MTQRSRKAVQKQPRLGAMAERREETQTSYMRVLLLAGITTPDTLAPGAWSLWLLVNEDPVVLEKKAKLPKINQRTGFLSRYAETAHVLAQMSTAEKLRLKYRVLCAPEKFF
jgi:hypothetical protein